MSKAHNSFYVTHSNQITHLTNLRYHNFEDEKNTMTISFSCLFLRGDM